jgi:subtilase family serine protease
VPEGLLASAAVGAQRSEVVAARTQVLARLRERSARVVHEYATVPLLALEIGADALPELAASPRVRRVMLDTLNAPLLATSVPLIEGDQLWARDIDGTGVTVAILDTGVDATHPFLAGKVVAEACFSTTAPASLTLCPSGGSRQIGAGAAVPCQFTDCWHGTHVAGIAAGNGDQAGQTFSGVAKNVTIIAVQIFSRFNDTTFCGGTAPCVLAYTSDIIAGLEQVYTLRTSYNIAAVNLSLGGGTFTAPCDSEPEKPIIDSLRSVGIATVIAAGNDGARSALSAPGCISSAVSVGSTTKTGVVSSFTNMASFLSVMAPGGSIVSSVPGGGYATASGTSMATPHVTGALALLKQGDPGVTIAGAVAALQQTGVPVPDLRLGGTVTKPLIQASEALSRLVPPAVVAVSPAVGQPGATLTTTVTGTMFAPEATVSFGAGVTVNSVVFMSAQQLTAGITVAAGAASGPRTVTVTNPGGASGARSGAFTVQAALADLVQTVGALPASVGSGATVSLSDTVTNQGASTAGASTTRYYLSTDAVKSSDDILLAATRAVPALAPGEASTGSISLTMPVTVTAGTYFVLACADDLAAVAEANESNNCGASASQVQITTPPPDLVITSAGNPPLASVLASGFTVTDTIVNRGGSPAGASMIRYYLSTDTTRSSGDVMLKGVRNVPSLPGGGSSTGTVTLSTASRTVPGVYYVLACADDLFAVAEGDESNNCTASAVPMTLTAPDLFPSNVAATPAIIPVGGTVVVSDTVTNQGTGASGGSFTRYFLSSDGVKSVGDISLGVRAVPGLAPQASSTGSVTLMLSANITTGSYRLLACVDDNQMVYESVEANNCAIAPTSVVIGASAADLVESAITTGAVTVAPGGSLSVTDTVTNQGLVGADATTTRFYLSADTVDADDVALTETRAVPPLEAGGVSTATVSVTVPINVAPGAYFLLACADDPDSVSETDETNNCESAPVQIVGVPDLTASNVSSPPASVGVGTSFAVTDTVTNQGTATAAESTTRYYLSPGAVKGGDAVLLTGMRPVPALPPGATSASSVTIRVPDGVDTRVYFLIACADDLDVVPESNEANNCVTAGSALVVATAPSDLAAIAVTSPPAAVAIGDSFLLTDAVANRGGATASASLVHYYLSLDGLRSSGDILLKGSRAISALDAGASSSGTATVSVASSTAVGLYYVLACADDLFAVAESNERNNCIASTTQVQIAAPDLVETFVSDPPATISAGDVFAVTDTVLNQGTEPSHSFFIRYYLSTDGLRTSGNVLLQGYRAVSSLPMGAPSSGTATVTVPSATLPGVYYVLACADDTQYVYESNEPNNCLSSSLPVAIGP